MLPLLAQVVAQSSGNVPTSYAPSYALGWGTLSLINAGLAQSKDRSGLFWWLISLFLGPVATFIIVAFLDKPVAFPSKILPSHDLS
jgi:peptidoglycan/LPS O-acetylase OafA/YrhL